MIQTKMHNIAIALWLLLNSSSSFAVAVKEILPPVVPPAQETNYKNKNYHFSFSIPLGWEKQSGHANSDNALFMQLPISNSCSFQFNIIPMPATFPAEVAATTALATAYHELRLNKLAAVKRRDTWIKEKNKEKGKEKEKIVIFTRGWEITEKPHKQQQQRIIYQVYDLENRYFNFVASASSANFSTCAPELRKIMDSISFVSL